MIQNQFKRLLEFLGKLQETKIAYSLKHTRVESIMVYIYVPGQRWEVEFIDDGSIEVEKFVSNGEIFDESSFDELFEKFSD